MNFNKLITLLFISALILNITLPSVISGVKLFNIDIEAKILTKIFGDEIVICSSENKDKFYISNFNNLSKEKKNKLSKDIDIALSKIKKNDDFYFSASNEKFILSLSNYLILPKENFSKSIYNSYFSSRSPPYFF
ncbi:MAG: hypothetical protein SFT90_07640 [Rickettsiales bacterium]|nr:hypothetical protein [Rickettsiales bacterium]